MAKQRKRRKGKPRHNQSKRPNLVEVYKEVKAESPDATPEFLTQQTAARYAAQLRIYMGQ